MEMAEEKIAERIDANLLNVPIQNLSELPKPMFDKKVAKIAKKTQGTLNYQRISNCSSTLVDILKHYLNELALKKSFKPDIIFIDYLNICASSRYRLDLMSILTRILKRLRKNSVVLQLKLMYLSSPLLRRLALVYGSSDVDLTDTSESFGFPATADLMFALI